MSTRDFAPQNTHTREAQRRRTRNTLRPGETAPLKEELYLRQVLFRVPFEDSIWPLRQDFRNG
jgi:hypothetical protein